jgi:hypothetical protein
VNGRPKPLPPWAKDLTDENDINAWIYESNRNLRDVLDETQDVYEQSLAVLRDMPDGYPIETIDGKFYPVRVNDQHFAVGEFFHHFYDDHAADVRAWLQRVAREDRDRSGV